MKIFIIFVVFSLTFLPQCQIASCQLLSQTTAERIRRRGYTSERHEITTKDGYILSLYRIVDNKSSDNISRPVVLMMHGLISSSDCWVIGNAGSILAFTLASQGYDVWLGNGRGTPYSKRHVSLSPRQKEFWRFSWHEIGIYDLPKSIDYILKVTQQSALHYVGHSQGTAIVFVLLSTQPKYNKKFKSTHLLAPIAYMGNVSSRLIRLGALLVGEYSILDPLLGDMALLQQRFLRVALGFDFCRNPLADPKMCSSILFAISGGASGYFNQSLLPEIFDTHPASCSTHQAIHLVQLYTSKRFRPYDFGIRGNILRYNRSSPPDYKVENINPKYPLNFYYSDYDQLSSRLDVEHFANILGNKTVRHYIDLKNFAHIDFLWATNVNEVLNRDIVARMNQVEEKEQEKEEAKKS